MAIELITRWSGDLEERHIGPAAKAKDVSILYAGRSSRHRVLLAARVQGASFNRIGMQLSGVTVGRMFAAICQSPDFRQLLRPEFVEGIDRAYLRQSAHLEATIAELKTLDT